MNTITDEEILQAATAAWEEFKTEYWRSWHSSDNNNGAKRLWAIALSSNWKLSSAAKMKHLLRLLPLAIEQAARLPAFASARTTFWTICRDPAGLERLAGGVYATNDRDAIRLYESQVMRLRLPEETLILVRAVAAARGITCSALVAEIIEGAMEVTPYPELVD
jgi:hypothetical protein